MLGAGNKFYVHDLVMLTFVGPKGSNYVRHIDNDGSNNCLSNLQYGTARDNTYDRQEHGTWGTKLTKRHIRVIRGLWKCGFKRPRLSELFGVSTTHITRITQRYCWNHIA